MLKENIILTLIKVEKKTLFIIIVVGVETIAIGVGGSAELQIQQRQLEIWAMSRMKGSMDGKF